MAAITSGFVFGETTKVAPAFAALATSAIVKTVPTPTQTFLRAANEAITSSAPGVVSVISIEVNPEPTIASAAS